MYDNQAFVMTYTFSNAIPTGVTTQTEATLYLYKDLSVGGDNPELNCKQAGDTPTAKNEYIIAAAESALSISEGGVADSSNSDYKNGREETVSVALDTDKISGDTAVFTEDLDGKSVIHFCVRFGLKTATGQEVNFFESLVTLKVDLTGTFEVTGIDVEPKEKLLRTANQDYELEAFQCKDELTADGAGDRKTLLVEFNQGDVIIVCVQPAVAALGDNIFMKEVETFEYSLLLPDSDEASPTKQLAISEKQPMYGLTSINECQGKIACQIQTILFATFYTRVGVVTGTGTATMQFGTGPNRKLRKGDRSLQADEEAAASGDFDVNFEIASNDSFQGTSGASSSMTIILAVFGSVAALML